MRLKAVDTFFSTCNFNPRTHVGCDTDVNGQSRLGFISIHAPTWGATRGHKLLPTTIKFQSTHPRGVRPSRVMRKTSPFLFQSTHPRGVRLRMAFFSFSVFPISIHAPTWGATVKPSNGWLLGHKDNEFANENIIIINSVNIT